MSTNETAGRPVDLHFLRRFMWLSVAAALATMAIKGGAAYLTGSVGLLSDALESTVNLAAALIGVWALTLAAKPADEGHPFGHGKAEYFSSLAEGSMILVAATLIVYTAIQRLIHPAPVEEIGVGLLLSTGASLINLAVALVLRRVGRRHRSIALEADGKHLMTDVWTSAGVLVGVGLVFVTGWQPLDPIVALLVGVNILVTGWGLLRRSGTLLLSSSIEESELALLREVEARVAAREPVHFLRNQTVQQGQTALVHAFMCVPDDWTVLRARRLAEEVKQELTAVLHRTDTYVHVQSHSSHDVESDEVLEALERESRQSREQSAG
ncbi:cation diffusion facilitator family transporter [Raineyella antarctica]|uniref:Cation diffusion facilitator family transporter n=1 Tax=Raineyella antarctica TaxID=1577474 RepID=A0A1G6HX14_9ACTN|nr:cation diffusion facilitator family transporter [Raineyella antarctica]SDB98730.1 cation diffusion facilitator family transporter [Raineyella antarctica]